VIRRFRAAWDAGHPVAWWGPIGTVFLVGMVVIGLVNGWS